MNVDRTCLSTFNNLLDSKLIKREPKTPLKIYTMRSRIYKTKNNIQTYILLIPMLERDHHTKNVDIFLRTLFVHKEYNTIINPTTCHMIEVSTHLVSPTMFLQKSLHSFFYRQIWHQLVFMQWFARDGIKLAHLFEMVKNH